MPANLVREGRWFGGEVLTNSERSTIGASISLGLPMLS